jgi:hypothetical protein
MLKLVHERHGELGWRRRPGEAKNAEGVADGGTARGTIVCLRQRNQGAQAGGELTRPIGQPLLKQLLGLGEELLPLPDLLAGKARGGRHVVAVPVRVEVVEA